MPLVFLHGVNTRSSDKDHVRGVAARRKMFEQIVVPKLVKNGFPNFAVAPDLYWGDLGVTFGWNLRAVPPTRVLESLGAEDEGGANLDLIQIIDNTRQEKGKATGVQSLGTDEPFVTAAAKDPAGLVRAIFATEADRFAVHELKPSGQPAADEAAVKEGEHLGLLLIAVEQLARDLEKPEHKALIQGTTDTEVLDKIESEVRDRYEALTKQAPTTPGGRQHLGSGSGGAVAWTLGHLTSALTTAKNAVTGVVSGAGRGASLVALKGLRDTLSRKGLRFLGDVFVYLQRGRTASPSIYERVRSGVKALDGKTNADGTREPFIIVTHSFGSEILYDLLTSGALDDMTFDLWVTVGAQTSLFAEMLLFAGMPQTLPPDTSTYELGRPANVKKWLNVYDAADVLSYLHEPVFGKDAVKDAQVRARGNVTNAHGHYFADPSFYELIAAEI